MNPGKRLGWYFYWVARGSVFVIGYADLECLAMSNNKFLEKTEEECCQNAVGNAVEDC